jgi:hypothetical protein
LVRFGWKTLDHPDFAMYEPGFARLAFWEEALKAIGLVALANPEYSNFVFEPPLRADAGFMERLRYSWNRFKRKFRLAWGLPIGQAIAHPLHCEFCTHHVGRFSSMMTIGLVLTISFFGSPLGLPLLVLGYFLNQKHYLEGQANQLPGIPLTGSLAEVKIEEKVAGHITLDAVGDYDITTEELTGTMKIPVRFEESDRRALRAYHLKAEHLKAEDLHLKAVDIGFMRIGGANWQFNAGDIWIPGRVNIVNLHTRQQNPQLANLFNGSNGEANWEVAYAYRVDDQDRAGKDSSPPALPVQAVVSLRSEANRQALDLEFEIADPNLPGADKAQVEQFTLWVPNSLGAIERVEPEGKLNDQDVAEKWPGKREAFQSITWKKLALGEQASTAYRQSLYIQFKEKIDVETRLEGEISILFPAALSGSREPAFYTSWGSERANGPKEFEAATTVTATLDLDLSGLRYQELEVQERMILRDGVVPNSHLITGIVGALSQEDFYIKRIIENPKRTSKEGAHKINRYWDIAGRKYEGVYPVDFHLVLTGEEVRSQGTYTAGQLKVTLSAQGAVTNEDMIYQIGNVSDSLLDLTQEAIDKIPIIGRQQAPPRLEARGSHPGEEADPVETQGTPVEVVSTGQPTIEVLRPIVHEDSDGRLQNLQRRIDLLEERLLEDKISQDLYTDLKAKYEAELWELSGGTLGKPRKKSRGN